MSEKENQYILAGGMEGKKRLKILSEVLRPYTLDLFTKQGTLVGKKFLDLGCGGGDVSLMVANLVGENGYVTGIDFDHKIIELAKQDANEVGIKNVEFSSGDVNKISFQNEYDIVYSRFLLSHLQTPDVVIKKMINCLKPGGRIIVEDVQFSGHFCYPESKAFQEYVKYYSDLAIAKDQNPEIGPSLFMLLKKAGLQDVEFDVIQPSFNKGPGKWMAYITLDKIKDSVISHGLADMKTIELVLQELEEFTNDEQSIISLPRIFRVWGVRE